MSFPEGHLAPDSSASRSWFWSAVEGDATTTSNESSHKPPRAPLSMPTPPSLRDTLFNRETQQTEAWEMYADASSQSAPPPKLQNAETQTDSDMEQLDAVLWSQCEQLEQHVSSLVEFVAIFANQLIQNFVRLETSSRQQIEEEQQRCRVEQIEFPRFRTLTCCTLAKVERYKTRLEEQNRQLRAYKF